MSLGGPAGASGSGAGGPAASAYTPTAQPQADVAYQGIVQNLFPYANNPAITPAGVAYSNLNPYAFQLANQDLINQGMQGSQNAYTNYTQNVYPAAQNLGQLIPGGAISQYNLAGNNPYAQQAQQGAITGASYAQPAAAQGSAAGQYLSGLLAPQVTSAGSGAYNAITGLAPQATQIGYGGQGYVQGLAPAALNTGYAAQDAINNTTWPLQGLTNQIVSTAFDPQSALYNRTQQQVVDQARAASAAAGISGSPYGAGVENQATENFNIDWQNQQLQRQATGAQAGTAIQGAIAQILGQGGQAAQTGIGAAGSLYGTGANLGTQGLTTAGNLYGQGLGALTSGAQTGAGLYGSGLNLGDAATRLAATGGALPANQYYGNLQSGTAVQSAIANLASQGLNIGTQGAQGLSTFAGQPYASLGTAINSVLTPGLSNAAQLGQQEFQIPQQVLGDIQSYLGLGQAASQLSGYLGNLGLQQTAGALSGIGQAAGGINNLFGSGGALSGLFGAGAGAAGADVTGLLSPAASAAFPAFDATTQALLSGGGAAAAGGGLDIGSILGLGFLGL